jgi:DNA polymerase-3 subunit gamma/tau
MLTIGAVEKKKSSVEPKTKEAAESKKEAEKIYETKIAPPVVAQEQESQPIKPATPQATGIPKTLSIREGSSPKQQQAPLSEPVSSSLLEASGLAEIMNGTAKPSLEQLWNHFADLLNKQGKMALFSAMKKRTPIWSDEQIISFSVDNASLEKDFNQLKPDLMEHLRKSMGPAVSLNIEVVKEEKEDRPYSAVDKYKRLAERNPKLNEMKKLFDLDVD